MLVLGAVVVQVGGRAMASVANAVSAPGAGLTVLSIAALSLACLVAAFTPMMFMTSQSPHGLLDPST